jgi:hypothetical protein
MTTLNAGACERVAELYTQSCSELLGAYGLAERLSRLDDRRPQPGSARYVSVLGLTGEGVRLVSTMDFDVALLRATYPTSDSAPTQQDLEDWCRELNNQLAGRLKNKLLPLGCSVMLGLPSLITGVAITSIDQADLDTRWIHFQSADGDLSLSLVSHIAPDVVLADEPAAATEQEAGILFEGGFQLF